MRLDHKDIDRLVSTYREDFTPDVEKGLRRLHGRITPVRQLRPHSRQTYLFGAAAAIALLVAFFFLFIGTGNQQLLVNHTGAPLAFDLPDGTRIVLQQGSEAGYNADEYNLETREVQLDGQAYFEVRPDADRPFLVANGDSELRVTGTAFNLRTEGNVMEVEVSEGSVTLEQAGERIAVAALECGLAEAGKPLRHAASPNLNHHAWRTGELKFDHTPISEVIGYFHDNWGIECTWAGAKECDYAVSGNYQGGDAGAVLEDIAKLGGLTLTATSTDGKHYELSGPCPL
ncbi:transmembrane sensor [Lewinella aquimaris]|uniref:Transmembrane sensor n=1 Tax=Neolewinella aquimaris TaxID=1835722 RepID=A0A840E3A4_9BACT|nr:FecR domain-containing protein [Neolewinella aquimaris]MBB4078145.1 transmembrane sensor [Neolewinella aquimaris]